MRRIGFLLVAAIALTGGAAYMSPRRHKRTAVVCGRGCTNVQLMAKDSIKYAATGGWGFAQFNDGKPVDAAGLGGCYACHVPVKGRDFVFTRYAP